MRWAHSDKTKVGDWTVRFKGDVPVVIEKTIEGFRKVATIKQNADYNKILESINEHNDRARDSGLYDNIEVTEFGRRNNSGNSGNDGQRYGQNARDGRVYQEKSERNRNGTDKQSDGDRRYSISDEFATLAMQWAHSDKTKVGEQTVRFKGDKAVLIEKTQDSYIIVAEFSNIKEISQWRQIYEKYDRRRENSLDGYSKKFEIADGDVRVVMRDDGRKVGERGRISEIYQEKSERNRNGTDKQSDGDRRYSISDEFATLAMQWAHSDKTKVGDWTVRFKGDVPIVIEKTEDGFRKIRTKEKAESSLWRKVNEHNYRQRESGVLTDIGGLRALQGDLLGNSGNDGRQTKQNERDGGLYRGKSQRDGNGTDKQSDGDKRYSISDQLEQALSLGMESAESDVMSRPPRNSKDGIFANGMGFAIGYQGILITLITIASYFIGAEALAKMHHAEAIANGAYSAEMLGSSMVFLTLSMAEIFHAFNMRSLHGSVFKIKKRNWWLWGAGILSLLLTTLVVEVRPLADAFDLAKLDGTEYAIAIALAFSIIPMVELVKAIARAVRKKKGIVLSA